jgi:enterochelin esterase-like enzyme
MLYSIHATFFAFYFQPPYPSPTMRHRFFNLLVCQLFLALQVFAQSPPPLPVPQSGTIERLENFPSQYVQARHVDVWLPDEFEKVKSSGQRFNVLYMHDGQMLFDAKTTWNKQAWNADQTVSRLMKADQLAPTIIVGVWNNGPFRHSEYFPEKFLPHMPEEPRKLFIQKALRDKPQSDAYLRFLVEELKPFIDAKYPTHKGPAQTAIMGSSMGGLISIYALNEYPEVFGGAAGLSTHWIGIHQPNSHIPLSAYIYLRDKLASPQSHKIYQDHGTIELDALYAPYQNFINQIIRDKGYVESGAKPNFLTRVFDGTGHNEKAWTERLAIPILFLLGK